MSYILENIQYSPIKGYKKSKITSGFGQRTFYNNKTQKQETGFHNGIDMTLGSVIVTPYPGKIIKVISNIKGYSEKYPSGNYIVVDHGNDISTSYCHLKYNSIKVQVGDIVSANSILATMGATGHATGVHLHYGLKINNKWVDPKDYLLGKKLIGEYQTSSTYIEYVIKKGDTLSKIAKNFNTTINTLTTLNNIKNSDLIITGEILKIPQHIDNYYIVKKGDTLSEIAKKYQISWKELYQNNKDTIGNNPNLIKIGLKLKI